MCPRSHELTSNEDAQSSLEASLHRFTPLSRASALLPESIAEGSSPLGDLL